MSSATPSVLSRPKPFLLAAGVLLAIALSGCDAAQQRDPNRPIVERIHRSPIGEMDVWRDRQTGCQYISYSSSSGLSVRVDRNGKPICSAPDGSIVSEGR